MIHKPKTFLRMNIYYGYYFSPSILNCTEVYFNLQISRLILQSFLYQVPGIRLFCKIVFILHNTL